MRALVLLTLVLVLIISSLVVYYISRDSDNDGISDLKEREYGTDPNKLNYLLAYALKKLPEKEALKFKDVDFDESSKGFVDLYASLPQDKRSSKEVNELLDKILSDNRIDDLEKNLFDDRFVNPTLPTIDNLNWTPTRENLDKIYDINVTFVAKDDKTPIAYVELRFVPVEYTYMIEKYGIRPEDYPKVFPPDKERDFVLTPVDGKFDSLEEKFSVPIKDIVGGREYRIVVLVKDSAGNERTADMKTPYIRQFENIAKTDNIIIAAFYYNWYTKGYDIPKDLPDKPLLGLYYSDDNIVFNKHVDWATGHGIDVFVFPYPYHNPRIAFTWLEKIFRKNMEAELFNQIKFTFGSTFVDETGIPPGVPWDFDNQTVRGEFVKAIKDLISNYASLPNYWKIEGKPVIVLWGSHGYLSSNNNVEKAIKEIREFSLSTTGRDLYITSQVPVVWSESDVRELIRNSDAIYDYVPLPLWLRHPMNLKDAVPYTIERMLIWKDISMKYGKLFIPSVGPGFNDTYNYTAKRKLSIAIHRLPEGFRLYLKEVKKTFNPKVLFLTSFNEWFEDTKIEPAQSYGFTYLEILKDVLRGG
ncbi:glycoside hydrolase family 99-like domain-containing protein [Candidatus Methanodesulfokora washburnensis]|uniref:Uncharacterized protein n=1 Tax=Candidatus Methanodesulfokora washburnensis TaxID=2478471 RepID=A0A429GHD5_9CREN|nr:glycoside hydrolase family 99-like domain-containing protein [Candidatus Methanodesulfokores washburnensis]RSN73301.1 hypothetical protein D6D85_10855 [Candidatus Methanodesulfokores washburnensis]